MANRQIVVIGLGRFGSSVAFTLYQMGHDVLALETDEALVQEAMGRVTYSVRADATQENVLRELGVPNFDMAVVAIGSNVEASIMATVLLKSMGIPYIVARARTQLHGRTLERVGADVVVHPEQETGQHVARSLFHPEVQDYMEVGPNFVVSMVRTSAQAVNRTLKDMGLTGARDKYGLAVLAIRRGQDVILLPAEDERIHTEDTLVLASREELLDRLRETGLAQLNGAREG
ncbi:MAG: TrkA family potassium uptake protein [Chloroflexi bacterium]|nr:TrkA family potassium uptake protein [Chloroflexota bacterium]